MFHPGHLPSVKLPYARSHLHRGRAAGHTDAKAIPETSGFPQITSGHRQEGFGPTEGQEHKEIRTLFNPGFSHQNVLSMMQLIVDEAEVFVRKMSIIHKKDSFVASFHEHAMSLTMDIIGRIVLGQQMNSQTQHHELSKGMHQLVALLRTNQTNFSPDNLNYWRMFKTYYL
jgi:cytochrome P450